jgi:polyadenylate-binding protein 2
MKQRVAEMEKEADKLRQLQAAAESATEGGDAIVTDEDKAVADSRSVFVGNASIFFSHIFTL